MRTTSSIPTLIWAAGLLISSGVSTANELTSEQLFEKVAPSVWGVTTFDKSERALATGSAVVIAPGTLITNCHVLAKAASFAIKRDNVSFGATLQHADTERDLCQITVRNFSAPVVGIVSVDTLKVGQKAFAIGNPRGLEVTLSDGLVSGLRRSDDGKTIEFVQTTAPISPGSSGGGLFDNQGRLIGITTLIRRDSQNLNFAVPGSWIAEVPARAQAALAARENAQNATTVATGARVGAQKRGAYHVGQILEYTITDRMTGQQQSVNLRVDRFDGDSIVFNGGDRTENLNGRVLISKQRSLSEIDSLNGQGGWVTADSARQGQWSVNSTAHLQPEIRYKLSANFVGETKLVTPAGEFDTRIFRFTGFREITTSRGGYGTGYEATAWYSESLKRIVKLTAYVPGSAGKIDEEIVLQRITN
ncbi:serine protease [Variovorax sp. PCZ-1]|uniref:S1C family serine protease n=1 Tax=Variovorax sp. PCZ-1 TaxID=2835533 RepID=UPI001BCCEC68|nr:serine protease [Variovorax sp. PCZ-1]MBS7806043.1 serine protease [Variovorax sp. PCZ-1]